MSGKAKIPWLLCVVVVLTNLSQLPFFVDNGMTQYATYSCWGVLALCSVAPRLNIHRQILCILALVLLPCIFSFVLSLFTGYNYLGTRILYCLIVVAVILTISHIMPTAMLDSNLENLHLVYRAYILSAAILSVVIYMNYFQTGFQFASRMYEYDSKNSTSQIVITAVILSLFEFDEDNKYWNVFNIACLAFNLMLLFLMRSRASIIGLVIVIGMVLRNKSIHRNIRFLVGAVSVVFLLSVFVNEQMYETIVENILFASRKSTDLEELTSGRAGEWFEFPQLFLEFPLFGRGRYKIESFPLSVLVQYGLVIGGIILILSLYPAIYAFQRREKSKHHQILLITSLVYLLNGLFEELSPFGPGVKCYFIWFLLGLLLREEVYENNTKWEYSQMW